ncbi:MAG TPA: thioesterase family protein [Steroidobacteraceae bacterium]|nr:thioesterase family protein [Steroidobacteraceae bacterium]
MVSDQASAGSISANQIAAEIDAIDYAGFKVLPEYIDANGHMNVGYYTLLFDKALDLPWEKLGIYSAQIIQTGKSSFALESHITYQRELQLGDPLAFTLQMLDFDSKRVHYFLRMFHATERYMAATCEQISICMDMKLRRSTPWSDEPLARITALHAAHQLLPKPVESGRAIGIRRK